MNTSSPALRVDHSTPELASFIAGCQKITTDYQNANFPNAVRLLETRLGYSCGDRYVRVSRNEYTKENVLNACSSHCFIDRTNGDVLKAASWKTPAKGARGNIFDSSNGLGRMTPYGAGYNR